MWKKELPKRPGWYFSTFEGWGRIYEVLEVTDDEEGGLLYDINGEDIEPDDINPERWYVSIPEIPPPQF